MKVTEWHLILRCSYDQTWQPKAKSLPCYCALHIKQNLLSHQFSHIVNLDKVGMRSFSPILNFRVLGFFPITTSTSNVKVRFESTLKHIESNFQDPRHQKTQKYASYFYGFKGLLLLETLDNQGIFWTE